MKLSEVNAPAALKQCSPQELRELAGEIRATIIRTVNRNGGHLASNLGTVELTIALHRAFDCPRDQIIFDVGHQCYAHKLLTGRYAQFDTLRQLDGLCGFPSRAESPYDAFGTGHASTALSAALGMARARDLMGEDYQVAAVVGDGAMTGGMCYEALNDVGSQKTQLMLVLNDNGMAISRNVGALSRQLTRLRISRGWLGMKRAVSDALRRVPVGSDGLYRAFQRVKNGVRNSLVRDKFFTSLGFRYFGPIDGHDIQGMERVFRQLREVGGPVVVHVVTKKGAGFAQAEENPEKFHGVPPCRVEGQAAAKGASLGACAGAWLTNLAQMDPRVCVVTAAMTDSTGFRPFADCFPGRLFDVGIAEEHAVTLAAGMAARGMRPFVAIYETFLQRGYDQIVEDVCLQRLPVCFLMDRAGLGGEDGASHHGVLGISMLRGIPHLTLLAPRCQRELEQMLDWALATDGPVAIRYPRAEMENPPEYGQFLPGKWETLCPGEDAAILSLPPLTEECLKAAGLLAKAGIRASVVSVSSISPLDGECLGRLARQGTPVFTAEEHLLTGGFGGAVAEYCARQGLPAPLGMLGLPDQFIPHGNRSALLERYHLSPEHLAAAIRKAIKK